MISDTEIIKALECCCGEESTECVGKDCPFFVVPEADCVPIIARAALGLINRYKEEREALINGQETLQRYIVEQAAEIKTLRTTLLRDAAKALKEKLRTMDRLIIYDEDIDNFIEELICEDTK